MDFMPVLAGFAAQYPIVAMVLAALGSLVIIGQAVVALTPSKSDDAAWEALKAKPIIGPILAALSSFAVIQKK